MFAQGKPYTSIQSELKLNDVCLVPNSGMIFIANESPKILIYFIPVSLTLLFLFFFVVSDNIVSDNIVSDNIVSDNIVSGSIVTDNIVSDNIVSEKRCQSRGSDCDSAQDRHET